AQVIPGEEGLWLWRAHSIPASSDTRVGQDARIRRRSRRDVPQARLRDRRGAKQQHLQVAIL
ncbi:hypothetical protein GGF41_006844, partial [Coemansia sp. RSA 2531]